MHWSAVFVSLTFLMPIAVGAETLVATRLIRAAEIIGSGDVAEGVQTVAGGASSAVQVVGLEARVALYPGRPIRLADLGPAAVVERNDTVQLFYRTGGLVILSDGRALARGGLGDVVRVMNLSSRSTVSGVITMDGTVEVSPNVYP
jgi:flagella basal body P-ring formation protein FlgA